MTLVDLPAAPTRRVSEPLAPSTTGSLTQRLVAALLIVGPFVAIAAGVPLLWGHALHLRDIVMAVVLYAITGHGITVGFHRLFTHKSFKPSRPLKIALA